MPLTTLVAGQTARAGDVNDNFALCVLTDTARTISATHTWSGSQNFTGSANRFGATDTPSGVTALLASRNLVNITPDTNTDAARGSALILTGYGIANEVVGARAGGTVTLPVTAPTGATLLSVSGVGYDGTAWAVGSEIQQVTTEAWAVGSHGTRVTIRTTAIGSASIVNTVTFTNTGTTSRIVPLATGLAFRNNADSADNILIADAGTVTFRGAVVVAGAVSGVTTLATSSTINSQTISASANFTGSLTLATTLSITGSGPHPWASATGRLGINLPSGQDGATIQSFSDLILQADYSAVGTNAVKMYRGTTFVASFATAGAQLAAGLALSASTIPTHGIQFGSSAPGTLANGQMWFDGTDFKVRHGGATKTITVA